jgi:hypothetical protein
MTTVCGSMAAILSTIMKVVERRHITPSGDTEEMIGLRGQMVRLLGLG